MTSRNVDGHWLTDFVYMGLNYQIEHHLFPNCPRINLPKITPYVKEICKKMKLEYTSVSIIETDKIILKELNDVAKAAFAK
jgi:fatty acid desaturase